MRKNLPRSQRQQKKYYDQKSKIKELKVGDLVMLKTQARFRLDRSFKGPFVVQSVSPTNAVIKAKDIDDAEEINVSRQRLSRCREELNHAAPWIGHGNKLRKRRKINKKRCNQQSVLQPQDTEQEVNSQRCTVTRSGRQVNKPARYRSVTAQTFSQEKREEVVRNEEMRRVDGEQADT